MGETADDYYRMFRIAAECSLMLNGRGQTYKRNYVDLVLTEQEAATVSDILNLCDEHEPADELEP